MPVSGCCWQALTDQALGIVMIAGQLMHLPTRTHMIRSAIADMNNDYLGSPLSQTQIRNNQRRAAFEIVWVAAPQHMQIVGGCLYHLLDPALAERRWSSQHSRAHLCNSTLA